MSGKEGKEKEDENSSFPSELKGTVSEFHENLSSTEKVLRALMEENPSTDELDTTEQARLELVSCFAVNSLVWVALKTQGINPQDLEVKSELGRVKETMLRLKRIKDKSKREKVNVPAAKRFIKNSLWTPGGERKAKR